MTSFKITVGADPELFVKQGDTFVSGHGLIQGDKKNPHKVEDGAVQVDGHALEFNIDPAEDSEGFVRNLRSVMGQLQAMVPDYQVIATPVAQFTKEYLASMPDEANELGCDPDFNAWDKGQPNPRPNGDVDFRTGGGHVHIGWTTGMDITDEDHVEAGIMLTQQLDYLLGLASLFWDDNDKRREMYGKAGAFRIKPYGVEYRSLSNAWLQDDELMKFVFSTTQLAAQLLYEGNSLANTYYDLAQVAINTNNRGMARDIIEVCIEGDDGLGIEGFFDSIPNKIAA